MLERVIEDLIANFPSEFFDEELKLLHRQMRIKGRVLDLLFEDSRNRLFLLEIKAFPLKRQDVGQAGEYFGLLKTEFPDREVRMGVFATSIEPEQRIYLEAIEIEIYIFDRFSLEKIAVRNNVDVVSGIPSNKSSDALVEFKDLDRFDVTNEEDYFKLIEVLSNPVQEQLAAIYAAIKKNPHTRMSFLKKGRVAVSVEASDGKEVIVLMVGVDFKGTRLNPARGTLTFRWKDMLSRIDKEALRPFATTLDTLLGRNKVDVVIDANEKVGTFDTIVLETDLHDDAVFSEFLKGLDEHFIRLEQCLNNN